MLPGIEGFHIAGEPKLGFKLTACGFPTNDTTLCNFQVVHIQIMIVFLSFSFFTSNHKFQNGNFQWVRYSDNGARQPIEGTYEELLAPTFFYFQCK